MGSYIETKRGNLPGNGAQALHPSAQETRVPGKSGLYRETLCPKNKGVW